MKALVIYESIFGNNKAVAEAIAAGLAPAMEATVTEVGGAPHDIPGDVDLLVIGGPTHQFGMSRPSSREIVAKDPNRLAGASRTGLREWLDSTPRGHGRLRTVVFCTGMAKPRFLRYLGSSGKSTGRRLKRLGFDVIEPVNTFWITGLSGPPVEGELDRARAWGASLGNNAHARTEQTVHVSA